MSEKITVGPRDNSNENSPIAGPVEEQATVIMNAASPVCQWNGETFDEGQFIVSEGLTYECSLGQWVQSKQ
jgi:hypothetical protein